MPFQSEIVLYASKALSTHTVCEASSHMEDAFVYGDTSHLFGVALGC